MSTKENRKNVWVPPIVGVGTWQFGSKEGEYWGDRKQEDIESVVREAVRSGPVLFDTAEAYNNGRSEECLAQALSKCDKVENVVLASKILPSNCKNVRKHLEATLKRLRIDSIDLYQVHWPIPSEDVKSTFKELCALQEEGKITHIGVSNFGVKQLQDALSTGVKIETNQMCFNLITRAVEFEVLPLCQKHNIGIICYSPLNQGLLTDKYSGLKSFDEMDPHRTRTRHFSGSRKMSRHMGQGHEELLKKTLSQIRNIASSSKMSVEKLSLAWAASKPGIVSVIPGARNVTQLRSNVDAIQTRLGDDVMKALDTATDELKRAMGKALDVYESDEKQRSF
jgi:myo-inositol catabolism protein IolS